MGPYAASVRELFGTDVLPTPFTEFAEANVVVARIRSLNPDFDVFVGSTSSLYDNIRRANHDPR